MCRDPLAAGDEAGIEGGAQGPGPQPDAVKILGHQPPQPARVEGTGGTAHGACRWWRKRRAGGRASQSG